MSTHWKSTTVNSVEELFDALRGLQGRRWAFRGQARAHGTLIPSIDREPLDTLSRSEKLALERQSIDTFRSSAKFFAHPGEEQAMTDPFVALMVLRHYGAPTRLLDWSGSPYVAAFFAACDRAEEDAEIWSFDEPRYEIEGARQWSRWPETTIGGTGSPAHFAAGLTAFLLNEPPDWFICAFYSSGFPRQSAQSGLYSMTARFAQDHAPHIARVLGGHIHHHRFLLPAKLKPGIQEVLRERHGIWRGSLFPDSAGAAETAARLFPSGTG